MSHKYKKMAEEFLALADVEINGSRPWDIQIHDERWFHRVFRDRGLGLGESYMDGWWDVEMLDEFFHRIARTKVHVQAKTRLSPSMVSLYLHSFFINMQSRSRAFEVGEQHYDIGNDLYKLMLDKRMSYSCGYWKDAKNLEEAQEANLDLICRKIGLDEGMTVLDIGCGFGNFAKFAAEHYGAKVVGINNSKEQAKFGSESCKGLPVEIRFQDYREVEGVFDRVVSIGMFSHVGYKNYATYMDVVRRRLKDDGLFLLHLVAKNVTINHADPWIHKYIFPNAMLPTIAQVGSSLEHRLQHRFVMEDWHNFGADYDPTLMAWMKNIDKHWDKLKENYSDRFYRMWKYYLLSSAGSFRSRQIQLWHILFSKDGVPGGYTSIR